MSQPSVQFQAVEGIRLLDFGEESIVLNPRSWDAHLINAAAGEILARLMAVPHSAREVEEFLYEVLLDSEKPRAAEHARRLLVEMTQLGLLREVTG
jgi:PqqD family protein of HPr-rel-A system